MFFFSFPVFLCSLPTVAWVSRSLRTLGSNVENGRYWLAGEKNLGLFGTVAKRACHVLFFLIACAIPPLLRGSESKRLEHGVVLSAKTLVGELPNRYLDGRRSQAGVCVGPTSVLLFVSCLDHMSSACRFCFWRCRICSVVRDFCVASREDSFRPPRPVEKREEWWLDTYRTRARR
ncbi:hypothetical protein F5883DRAFT_234838 [Diaporthe sp. PMI_573]|nr:hypothetical protein F5883DRAFT_234838 [Diaporthaceae sp. PMI_573]